MGFQCSSGCGGTFNGPLFNSTLSATLPLFFTLCASSWVQLTITLLQTTPSRSQRPSVNETPPPERQQFDPLPPARTPDRNVQHGANGMKSAADIDPSYLSPYRNGVRPALSGSRSGSEADSLIDLYGRPRSIGEGSVGIAADRDRPIPPEELYLNDEDPERSRWIHRDKLALIESHEMREAGIKLPQQQTRLTSKSKLLSESVQSHGVPVFLSQEAEELPTTEREQRRTRSPTRPYEDGHETLVNEFDLRTPEEIAADNDMDRNPSNSYRQQDLRKTSSRIPLPRSSPLPIPQGHIERDTPLPRKRGVSGTWAGEENGISYNRIRSRGNSVGSQVLLDDPDASYYTPTHASRPGTGDSPNTTRVISNKPTSTHSRKTSLTTNAPTIHQKPRQSSVTASPRTPSSTQRPKSRSGLEPRPPTAINRPEGDAPWLATMYKPDPRLPPDQQILPTHAKRLQQEQWERARKESEQRRLDGKASPQLPREFSPLAEHTVHGLQPSSSRDAEEDEKVLQERGSEWPLTVPSPNPHKSIPSPTPPAPDEGPHTSAAGAYSPIPHARVKKGESPVPPHPPVVVDPFVKERLARADEEKRGHGTGTGGKGEEEEGKKEKGCGCCSVM
jgi:hypothetical protein